MGVSKQQQREHARLLYVGERITLKEVAERVGVTEKTVGRWCKEDGWEELKKKSPNNPANTACQMVQSIRCNYE